MAASVWAQSAAPEWREFSIGPPIRGQSGFSREGIRAEGITLRKLIARAYGLPEHRIVGPAWINNERYALKALVLDPKDLQPLLQRELQTRFQMSARRENKEVPVYVLKSIDGAPPPAGKGASVRPALRMPQADLTMFADALADMIQRPVFNETGIDGAFDIALGWQLGDDVSLQNAVREQLGLLLAEEKRAVDLVYIDRIEKLTFPK
jgi:uncharacterized protein (TIGR03435 family)